MRSEDPGDDAVREAREEVIDAMERAAEIYGVSRSYGRLYGILYFAEEPVSLDALAEESGFAKSTVSSTTRELQRLHLVRRRSVPGEGKRAFYEAERDFWAVCQDLLDRQARREIDTMLRSLETAAERLEAADGDQAERDLQKVRDLQRTYRLGRRLVSALTGSSAERLVRLVERLASD